MTDGEERTVAAGAPADLVAGVTAADVERVLLERPDLIEPAMRSLGDIAREAILEGRL